MKMKPKEKAELIGLLIILFIAISYGLIETISRWLFYWSN